MRIIPGDTVFNNNGQPGVAMRRDPLTKKVEAEREGENYEKTRTYGFINGLAKDERVKFQNIVDKVREHSDPDKRLEEMGKQIDEVAKDPRNHHLTRYLLAEQAHLMHSNGVSPKGFTVDETKI